MEKGSGRVGQALAVELGEPVDGGGFVAESEGRAGAEGIGRVGGHVP